MPAAIAFSAFQAGLPLALVNAIAGVGVAGAVTHGLVGLGLSVGASYAAQRVLAPTIAASPLKGQIEFQQDVPVRFWPYGTVKLSGPLGLLRTADSNADITGAQLTKITLISAREIDGLVDDAIFLNDEGPWTLDGSLYFVGYLQDGENHIAVKVYRGTTAQTADPSLVALFPGWSSAHRLRGIAYVITWQGVAGSSNERPENFMAVYGGTGQKEARPIVRGVKVYDPREDSTNGGSGSHRTNNTATWEYSDNVTLCALDWLAHPDGRNKGFSRIDWASFVAAANIDDENVDLKAGGTEKRYRVATIVRLDEARKDVMARILQARNGQLFKTADGKFGMRGGVWEAPDVTLDADDGSTLIEADMAPGLPRMSRINELQLKAMLPTHGWNAVDLQAWTDTTDTDYIAGRIFRQPLDLSMVPSNSQAQRLAKQILAVLNPRWAGTIRTDLKGLNALGERVITLNWDELDTTTPPDDDPDDPIATGLFNGAFLVNGPIEIDATGVSIPVISADEQSFDWDEDTEEQDAPEAPEAA